MTMYHHSPLPSGSDRIRLLRILPHDNEAADIRSELVEYSLHDAAGGTHPYEALSYVWDHRKKPQSIPNEEPRRTHSIWIDEQIFHIGGNLHAALSRLRNRSLERVIWVDAICINQDDDREKEHQIQFIPTIYSQACRVIVWLGPTENDSDLAIEEIRVAAGKHVVSLNNDDYHGRRDHGRRYQKLPDEKLGLRHEDNVSLNNGSKQVILALFGRKWFQRIWVLQEVAAARHILVICGETEIDGHTFCLGVDPLLEILGNSYADLDALIRPVTSLIKGAIFRPRQAAHGGLSLDIFPLCELIDMFHSRAATKRHDKVYALLGMSSENSSPNALRAAGLSPDYGVPWKQLLSRLIKYLLPETTAVETRDDGEMAVIKSTGCVIGYVVAKQDTAWRGRRKLFVCLSEECKPQEAFRSSAYLALQASANQVQKGDIVCLLQGASRLTIVRPCQDHFVIVMIAAALVKDLKSEDDRDIEWSTILQSPGIFTRDFLLVWDWQNTPKNSQNLESSRISGQLYSSTLERSNTVINDSFEEVDRVLDVVIVLWEVGCFWEAEARLREAMCSLKHASHLDHVRPTLSCRDAGKWYNMVANRLLQKPRFDPDSKGDGGRTVLLWAADGGYEATLQLMLATEKVNVNCKDIFYETPLLIAAGQGHEEVVKLLIATGQAEIDYRNNWGRTPLLAAAGGGHDAVVKLLLETGQVEIEHVDDGGHTPLLLAAGQGHEEVVKLLLETGQVKVNHGGKDGQTPLLSAASGGHDAVVKLLLETGQVEIDHVNNDGQTPLLLAAGQGHEEVVKLLLETGQAKLDHRDNAGQTPLSLALRGMHEAVFNLLLATRRERCSWTAPLSLVAKRSSKAVVKLLQPNTV